MATTHLTFLIDDLTTSMKKDEIKIRRFITGIDREIGDELNREQSSLAIFDEATGTLAYKVEVETEYAEIVKCLMHNVFSAKLTSN